MADKKLIEDGNETGRSYALRGRTSAKPPKEAMALQLKEARAEWRKRHPKPIVASN